VLLQVAGWGGVLQGDTERCNVLQCLALRCSVLQCVSACSSVSQRIAVRDLWRLRRTKTENSDTQNTTKTKQHCSSKYLNSALVST